MAFTTGVARNDIIRAELNCINAEVAAAAAEMPRNNFGLPDQKRDYSICSRA
jgi:hypothetical protein